MQTPRNLWVLIISLAFVAAGVFILVRAETGDGRAVGVFSLLFFGGVGLVAVAEGFFDAPPLSLYRDDCVVVTPRRLKYLLMGVGSAMWAGAGVMALSRPDPQPWMAWALIAFGAIGFIVLLAPALNLHARVVIDRNGIADYRSVGVMIPWSDVKAIDHDGYRGGAHMRLWLHDPEKYRAQRRFNRSIDPIELRKMGFEADSSIATAIQRLAPAHLLPVEEASEWDDDDEQED
jgi:hypothetical protein